MAVTVSPSTARIHLSAVLINTNRHPQETVAINRGRLLKNDTFKIGNAIDRGPGTPVSLLWRMATTVRWCPPASKAGCVLMRSRPPRVWFTRPNLDEAIAATRVDPRRMHPDATSQWAKISAACTLRHLAGHSGDPVDANQSALFDLDATPSEDAVANKVRSWSEEYDPGLLPDIRPRPASLRNGFASASDHLRAQESFENARSKVLAGDSDTDTVPCIVGAPVGVPYGVEARPVDQAASVTGCHLPRPAPARQPGPSRSYCRSSGSRPPAPKGLASLPVALLPSFIHKVSGHG